MQREQTPVLRFNLAAFVLCAASMVVFGYWMNERLVANEASTAVELEHDQNEITELRAAITKLDVEIQANRGCTLGSHSTDAEIRRAREALDQPNVADEIQKRVEAYRREQADSAIYPSLR